MDYVIPCGQSKVHPDGICKHKLHRNIAAGLTRMAERHEREATEAQLAAQHAAFEEQKRNIDLQQKMLGVGAGTHRVIKENRTKTKPRVTPIVLGTKPKSK